MTSNYIYKMSNAGGMSTVTRYTDMLAGNATFIDSSYESIQTVAVGSGGQSTISFTSISGTYKHLQIRLIARGNNADLYDSLIFKVNSDTANNYTFHSLGGNGSTPSAGGVNPYGGFRGPEIAGATSTTGIFGVCVADLLDYTNTNKNKTMRMLGGVDRNGSGGISLTSGVWMSTAAITRIDITPVFGSTFVQYSSFALYGIKG